MPLLKCLQKTFLLGYNKLKPRLKKAKKKKEVKWISSIYFDDLLLLFFLSFLLLDNVFFSFCFLILFIYFLLHKQKTYYLCTQRMWLIMDCLVSSSDLKRSEL